MRLLSWIRETLLVWVGGLSLCLAVLCASGCRTSDGAGQVLSEAESGTIVLSAIGGHTLPHTPPHAGGAPEVRAGSITLASDGTFTSSMTYGGPGEQTFGRDFSGDYTRNGSELTLRWQGAGTTTAEFTDDAFVMNNEGLLFTYQRRR